MDEMNVYSIDRGDEVWQSFQLRFALAPVVVCRPVAGEFLHRRELHTLRLITNSFLVRPTCCLDAPLKIGERFFWNVDVIRSDRFTVVGHARHV